MKRTFSILTLSFALVLVIVSLVLLATPSAHAAAPRSPSYSIAWYTMDGGGGTSTSGSGGYSVSGTIGPPSAGSQSGGGYSLEGGFWNTALGDVVTDLLNLFLPFIRR